MTLLPMSLMPALQEHLLMVRSLHHGDLEAGWGRVLTPYALARKYPNANREWAWQWVFPSRSDGATGIPEARAAIISIRAWCRRR